MRVSRDPLEPLRSWKELFFPSHREAKSRKQSRSPRYSNDVAFAQVTAGAHGAAGE